MSKYSNRPLYMELRCEHDLYVAIAQFMQVHYPDTIYRFDIAADMKLTPGQARKHKILHPVRGYPDLFIAEPNKVGNKWVAGLYLELKKEGTKVYKRDGNLVADSHIREQAAFLDRLNRKHFIADFAIGYEDTINKINNYLGGGNDKGRLVEF